MQPRDKLAAARLAAARKMPYFRAAVLAMVPREAPGLGTFGVSRHGVLMWDPEVCGRWSVDEVAGVLLHEVGHLLRHHADRRERLGAQPATWNVAGDLAINCDLLAAGVRLPGDGVWPGKLGLEDGLTTEEYYRALSQQAAGAKSSGEGEGEGEGDVGRGRCGGCAGRPEDWEQEEDRGGRSEAELERVRRQVAEAVRREAESGRGTVPQGLVRWADGQLRPPQVPWRQKLRRAVRGALAYRPGAVDYHWTRPSRRQAGIGWGPGRPLLPALRAPVPSVCVAVDTSGSMGADELTSALSEMRGVLQATGAGVTFLACDARVHELREVERWQDAAKLLKGGGGTSFVPVFEELAGRRRRPDVVVFVTDGCGPAPQEPPGWCKVIWVLVGPHRRAPCAWGEAITIDPEGEEAA